jgi:hypothetical protein
LLSMAGMSAGGSVVDGVDRRRLRWSIEGER